MPYASYLGTFVEGMKNNVDANAFIHPGFSNDYGDGSPFEPQS